MNSKIFVQIASYRDPELVSTLKDCVFKADAPENLVFSIAWQHSPSEYEQVKPELDALSDKAQFKILEFPWQESKGVCWARYQLQQQYDSEPYTLHLDSHHRFARGWDTYLINTFETLVRDGIKKPMLTTYVNNYRPMGSESFYQETDPDPDSLNFLYTEPCADTSRLEQHGNGLVVSAFTHHGVPMHQAGHIKPSDAPTPGTLYSGHFCFAHGSFVSDVPHDPEIYFLGEENTISLRAFTHGYDVFHPPKCVIWHEYMRMYTLHKHWSDHEEDKRSEIQDSTVWHERDLTSQSRCRALFGTGDDSLELGKFGLGDVRTRDEFIQKSGIIYRKRALLNDNGKLVHNIEFKFDPSHFEGVDKSDIEMICCAAHTDNMFLIHRTDITQETHAEVWDRDEHFFYLKFESTLPPTRIVTWPCLKSGEWVNRRETCIWNE
ncbi:MAG: GlcNAc-transferase family protein [Pseudomonadota bacterium]